MELFRNTRLKIANSILQKKLARVKRKVHYSNFGQVKSIGIVWDASQTADFPSLSRFYQRMHDRNIDVKILGYYGGKELPDQYTAIRYLSCIKRKELSFFYLPDTAETDYFIRNRFDILIDINFGETFPLRYITSLSSSSFKVGLYSSDTGASTFDLMIDLKKPFQVENYLNESINYLEMINSGSPD